MSTDKRILNIGCGRQILEGAENLDKIPFEGVDKVWDLKDGLPYQDGQFDKVIANYVLCQISSPEGLQELLNDIWRVLRINGWLEIKVPNAKHSCAWQDPMDCRRFVPETFDYFDKDHYRYQAFRYGFKPWHMVQVVEEGDRLFVKMRKSQNALSNVQLDPVK